MEAKKAELLKELEQQKNLKEFIATKLNQEMKTTFAINFDKMEQKIKNLMSESDIEDVAFKVKNEAIQEMINLIVETEHKTGACSDYKPQFLTEKYREGVKKIEERFENFSVASLERQLSKVCEETEQFQLSQK